MPPPDQINALDILEAVVGPHVEHLVKAVRQIEGRPFMNLILLIPIGRRDHPLIADPAFQIDKTSLCDLSKYLIPESITFLAPVDIRILMRDRNKNVQGAAAFRRQSGIGYSSVLDVKRGVLTQDMPGFDFLYVLRIVFGNVDGVVRQIETSLRCRDRA